MHGSACWPQEAKTLQSCSCAAVGVGRIFANHLWIEAFGIQSKPAIAYHLPKSFASCTRIRWNIRQEFLLVDFRSFFIEWLSGLVYHNISVHLLALNALNLVRQPRPNVSGEVLRS